MSESGEDAGESKNRLVGLASGALGFAGGAAGKVGSESGRLVGVVTDGYRNWSGDEELTPIAPSPSLLPAEAPGDAAAAEMLAEHDPLASHDVDFAVAGLAIDPDAVVLAALVVAASIATQITEDTHDKNRIERTRRVVAHQYESVTTATKVEEAFAPGRVLTLLTSDWTSAQRMLLLVETAALNPFAPYEIAWDTEHEQRALAHVAQLVGLPPSAASDVAKTFADAARAHTRISATRVGLYGLGAAAVLGSAGFLAAPMLGAALGSAAGLSGAAATSSGLGMLGAMGGATAPGTMTAGGMWLVANVGAATGAVVGTGGSLLYEVGAARAQNEIIKLQATYKLVIVDMQRDEAVALQVVESLHERVAEIEAALAEELKYSDPGSTRVADLEDTLESLANAESWMETHDGDLDDGSITVKVKSLDSRIARIERLRKRDEPIVFSPEAQSLRDMLDADELERIDRRIACRFAISADLDRWDVLAGVSAGIVAAVIDAYVVADPTNGVTAPLKAAFAHREETWLSKVAKVPFDQSMGEGFTPMNHRVLTPGHDPLLGLVLGTYDILNSTMTRSTVGGAVQFVDRLGRMDHTLFSALQREMYHLLSDVITPAGLPLPGWTALTMSEDQAAKAVSMYTDGYDTWHLAPMYLPVASIHAVTSLYWAMRSADGEEIDRDRKDGVSLLAHGVASAGDLGTMLLSGGNPLALNYVMWLSLARRVISHASRRTRSSAEVTMDDVTRSQQMLGHGWAALLEY